MKELTEYRKFMKKEELHKSLNSLVGILSGIVVDGVVSDEESNEVKMWFELHKPLVDIHPFSEILPFIESTLSDNHIDLEEAKDVLWLCNKFLDISAGTLYFNEVTSQIQYLEGMLHGIITDGVISDQELQSLNNWLNDNEDLAGTYPYDEVYSLLLAAKDDGVISEDERNMLRAFFSNFVDTRESANIHDADRQALQQKYSIKGICAIAPEISFEDKTFCFTGASKRGTRNEIADIICNKGGMYNDRVTKGTNYLIVGADGNPCWAFSCYGRKVEKAMDMRKLGHQIIIVNENDFWDEF